MTTRFVLLALDWLRSKDPRMSLGHASILARLDQVPGLEIVSVRRAVNSDTFSRTELLSTVLAEVAGADLGVGVYVWNDPIVRWLLTELRRSGFTGRIILGGPQLSYADAGVAALYPEANVLIRGYGEDALAAVLASSTPRDIPGVTWVGRPGNTAPARVDLSTLPSPILEGVLPVQPFMRWETQRGCQFKCSFCQHREAGSRLERNTLSSHRVAAEIQALVDGGASDIAVLDPIFNANPDAPAILRRFKQLAFKGRLSLQARFETLSDEFLDACEGLDVRLEFGLQTVQASEMRAVQRPNNLRSADAAICRLHNRSVRFEVSLIYGLPTQTLESFEDTIQWCLDRGVETLLAFPLMLLRGTGLDRDRDRWALVESDGSIPVVVESDTFSRADWEGMQALAEALPAITLRNARAA